MRVIRLGVRKYQKCWLNDRFQQSVNAARTLTDTLERTRWRGLDKVQISVGIENTIRQNEAMTSNDGFKVPDNKRRYVKVPGRDDVGEVLTSGHNFGSLHHIYTVGVHFPLDGLCAYYDSARVTYVDSPDA